MKIQTPAKINLSLEITGRMPNGFHELHTVFQTIDLCDELEWQPRDKGGLILKVDSPSNLGPLESNLVWKAITAFTKRVGSTPERIHGTLTLVKRIPAGGGLGGGSSNAAGTLLWLNHLHGHPLPMGSLHELALNLGSDVPFFLLGGTCLGRGRGEELTRINLPPDLPRKGFLVLPPFGCPTGKVFKAFAAMHPPTWKKQKSSMKPHWGLNDLETAGCTIDPRLAVLRSALEHAIPNHAIRNQAIPNQAIPNQMTFMSGSGSSWIVLTENASKPQLNLPFPVRIQPFTFSPAFNPQDAGLFPRE